MTRLKIAILASGSGSNAQAIMDWARQSEVAEVVCVLSDKKDAFVLERARKVNVATLIVLKKRSESRQEFDQKMLVRLSDYNPDWIVLAGFMKLLTPVFLDTFKNRVVNIHPSLLPLYPGKDGYAEAFRANVKESGCTIHFVDEGVDTGEIIDQRTFDLIPGESLEEFKGRGLKIENEFYPIVLERLFKGLL